MVVLLSDLLFDRELALAALRYLRHRGHQVIVFHLMDPAEVELVGPPEVRFRDPESAVSVVVRPRELARAYADTVRREIAAWRTACRRHGIAYHEKTLGQLFCDRSARDIVAMLEAECAAVGARILTGCRVASVGADLEVATSAGALTTLLTRYAPSRTKQPRGRRCVRTPARAGSKPHWVRCRRNAR